MKNDNIRRGVAAGVRLTRRSYRRKLIMFGFSIFMSLALTATGFSAWVLSKDAMKETSGQVQVGAVTEASIEISDIVFLDKDGDGNVLNTFLFEPLKDDNEGRVRNNGVDFEDMDLNIQWKVTNYQLVGDYFVEFKLPEGVYSAIEEGYITLPVGFGATTSTEIIEGDTYYVLKMELPKDVKESKTGDPTLNYTYTSTDGVEEVTFTLTLKFNWGSEFGGENPSTYFDDNETGKLVAYDDVKLKLNHFKTTVHNLKLAGGSEEFKAFNNKTEDEQAQIYEENPIPDYLVVIHATVK